MKFPRGFGINTVYKCVHIYICISLLTSDDIVHTTGRLLSESVSLSLAPSSTVPSTKTPQPESIYVLRAF